MISRRSILAWLGLSPFVSRGGDVSTFVIDDPSATFVVGSLDTAYKGHPLLMPSVLRFQANTTGELLA